MASKEDFYLLVAAIDFGTAYSGYAFSSREQYKSDPLKVSANTWLAGKLMSLKTTTCILFDDKKKFHSFGYVAEDKYSDLASTGQHGKWYFFKRFKMELFDKMKLKRKFMLEEEMGKNMPAIEVFSASIKFMKDNVLELCGKQLPDITVKDIRWVLTVPAIWNDSSKQFMREAAEKFMKDNVLELCGKQLPDITIKDIRWVLTVPAIWNDSSKQFNMREAAEKAGIDGTKLLIALEPEAASLCCQKLDLNTSQTTKGMAPFAAGEKYVIFDAGGGTIDITVHQVQHGGWLRELYKATGGNWGGIYVDKAFRNLIADIVGNGVIDNFQANNMEDYLELFREFEGNKRKFSNNMTGRINLRVPIALNNDFKDARGKDIKDELESRPEYKGKVSWIADKLSIQPSIAKSLFKDAVSSITKHLHGLFKEQIIQDVSTILMVGGFSESPMLQDIMRETFSDKRVIIPNDPGLAVLKGAVIFGHDPSAIKERRCKHTYGIQTSIPFDPKKHPEGRKFRDDTGEFYCSGIFDRHVQIGQPVLYGESQYTGCYSPTRKDQNTLTFVVYASSEENPTYVTDASCTPVGKLDIDISGSGMIRAAEVEMFFSGTEIEVRATQVGTKNKVQAKFEFLE